jgi:osmoprotectant transport system substrate-binding protein
MRARRIVAALAATGTLFLGAACAGNDVSKSASGSSSGAGDKGPVTISGQNFTEAALMANMYKLLLENEGYSVTMKLVGSRDVYLAKGQFPGAVDVVPEYLGGIADKLNQMENGSNAKSITTSDVQSTLAAVKPLADKAGITLLQPAEATDQNAFFVTKKYADQNSLKTLSDLGSLGKPVLLAAAPDCEGRTDCAGGLSNDYGIKITKVLPLGYASPQTFDSVLKGEAQLGETSTTDASLASQGLVLLEDDKHIQPVQNLIPAVSTDFLNQHSDVKDALNSLMAKLTTDDLTQLNGKVGNERQKPEDVAKQYLQDQGLLS